MQERDESSPDAADEGEGHSFPDVTSGETPTQATAAVEPTEPDAQPTGEEELPEWEPLTPELVEDEAIRGDFMLRWSAILLALLMGWTVIQETSVLTHIKTGQYLAGNGFLPPATDVFSATATDRRWVNLSWLWDLTMSGVYGVGGAAGVSIFKALLAAVTFWVLSRISLPELPTWWGSVCAVLALLAAFPSLTATPQIITLLGMACLLWLIHRWMHDPTHGSLWSVVVLLWVWCQFDDRAWIGLITLLSFSMGHWIDGVRNTGDEKCGGGITLALATGASLLAMVVHPFLWETLRSPAGLYQLEYPTLQQYTNSDVPFPYELFPVWSSEFWSDTNYFNAAGLLLWMMTLVTLVLNRDRLRFSHLAVFVVLTGFSFAGGRELAVAGIANAVLATVNAQQWYLANFRQTYSVETSELLFSRGGRAMTVMAFFALGFAMVSGHLTGADGRRVGMGLDPQLQQTITSYKVALEDSYDDRAFNFRLFQGDVLNWIGKRPFIDSRVRLFAAGPSSVVEEHLALRPTLRKSEEESAEEENRRLWQASFDRYKITHVLPRLSGTQPDYSTFRDLSQSRDWTLARFGAATAVFYRADTEIAELRDYVAEHDATDFVSGILRNRDERTGPPVQRIEWPRPPTVYDRFLYLPDPFTSNILQEARHYSMLVRQGVIAATRDHFVSTCYAAIRKVHEGLADNPSDQMAYHILGDSYGTLQQIERFVMQEAGQASTESIRNLQLISAYHHALMCDPRDVVAHYQLFRVFFREQRHDLALHHLQQLENISGRLTPIPETDQRYYAEQEQNNELRLVLMADLAEVRRKLEEQLAADESRLLLVQNLAETGYLLTALETLEEDLTVISGEPGMTFLYAQMLLEAGRTEEAHSQLQGLKTYADQGVLRDWHAIASLGQMVAEDLTGAVVTLQEEYEQLGLSAAVLLMQSGPLQASGPNGPSEDDHRADPLRTVTRQTQASSIYFSQLLPRIEDNEIRRALIHLELGNNLSAEQLFQKVLDREPATQWRSLAEMYLQLLTDGADIPPLPADDDSDGLVPSLFDDEDAGDEPATVPKQPGGDDTPDSQESKETSATPDADAAAKPPPPQSDSN